MGSPVAGSSRPSAPSLPKLPSTRSGHNGGKSDPVRSGASGKLADAVVVPHGRRKRGTFPPAHGRGSPSPNRRASLKNPPCARAVWKAKPAPEDRRVVLVTAGGSSHQTHLQTTSVGREVWEDFARTPARVECRHHETTNACFCLPTRLSAFCRRGHSWRSSRRRIHRGSLPDAITFSDGVRHLSRELRIQHQ